MRACRQTRGQWVLSLCNPVRFWKSERVQRRGTATSKPSILAAELCSPCDCLLIPSCGALGKKPLVKSISPASRYFATKATPRSKTEFRHVGEPRSTNSRFRLHPASPPPPPSSPLPLSSAAVPLSIMKREISGKLIHIRKSIFNRREGRGEGYGDFCRAKLYCAFCFRSVFFFFFLFFFSFFSSLSLFLFPSPFFLCCPFSLPDRPYPVPPAFSPSPSKPPSGRNGGNAL